MSYITASKMDYQLGMFDHKPINGLAIDKQTEDNPLPTIP